MPTQTFNIALPRELVQKIDNVAKQEYRNRSELIREAVLRYLKEQDTWAQLRKYGDKVRKRMGIRSEEDVYRIVDEYRHGKQ